MPDYALWLEDRVVGIVEAKKLTIGPQNVLTQAERYARGPNQSSFDFDGIRCPFLYATEATARCATQPGQAIPRYDRGMNTRTPLPPVYDRDAVAPLWQELAAVGVEPLTTPEQVDALLRSGSGTALVIVNSVCGCAAGQARPGAMLALQNGVIPDRSVTVFAGVDRDAVEQARGYMTGYPPSSPSIGLFKDGKLVSMLQRTDLQQMNEEQVSQALCSAFDEHCSRTGPSIAPEEFQKIRPYRGCGSKIPLASAPQ